MRRPAGVGAVGCHVCLEPDRTQLRRTPPATHLVGRDPINKTRGGYPGQSHYKFITIGPKDSPYAVADGINNAGLVTGYYHDLSSVFHGFVWQKSVSKRVDYPGAAYT